MYRARMGLEIRRIVVRTTTPIGRAKSRSVRASARLSELASPAYLDNQFEPSRHRRPRTQLQQKLRQVMGERSSPRWAVGGASAGHSKFKMQLWLSQSLNHAAR